VSGKSNASFTYVCKSLYLSVFFFFVLGYLTNVSVIETEGVTDGLTNAWIESYYVSLSNSSERESFVNYTEQGDITIVSAMLIRMCLYCLLCYSALSTNTVKT